MRPAHTSEELAREYLRKRPGAAAQVLERLAPADSAGLLEHTPARIGGPVIGMMMPYYASHCLAAMPAEAAAALLIHTSALRTAALLRALDTAMREAILAQLPGVHAAATRLLLAYPASVVGAWIEPRVLTLPASCAVAEAHERVRECSEHIGPRIYVIDRDHKLVSAVEPAALLRAPGGLALAELALASPASLRARTSLDAALALADWREHSEVAVLNRRDEFIGVLRHAVLHEAAHHQPLQSALRGAEQSAPDPTVGGLAEIMIASAAAAWRTWSDLLDGSAPSTPEHQHERRPRRGRYP